jgi:hypothetical protein
LLKVIPLYIFLVKNFLCLAPVAHACNPSYSGGSGQEDRGSKSAQADSPSQKRLVEWLKVKVLSSSPSISKKKKKFLKI